MFLRPVVVLHAAGSHLLGVGALSRTATLARALLRSGVWQRILVIWEAPPELVEHFAPEGCEVLGVEDRETALEWRSLLAPPGTYGLLISDLRHLPDDYCKTARDEGYRRCAHLQSQPSDLPVGVDLVIHERGVGAPSEPSATEAALSPILRESVVAQRPAHPWTGDRPQRILLTLGGADPNQLTFPFLQQIRPHLADADLHLTATLGPAFHPNQRFQIQRLAAEEPRIQIADAPRDLTPLILAHDFTLTLGGLTSYEGMALGRPGGAIAQPHTAATLEALEAQGLLANLGSPDQAAPALLERLAHPQTLHALAAKGWHAIDGTGADRAAQACAQLLPSTPGFKG